ncbi:MAG: hypothetical protein JXA57_19570 [Armatimonadetes bacterium]|nr:hypothetical protein [Armatimonadota bacterium]
MTRVLRRGLVAAVLLALSGCGGHRADEDAVSVSMKQTVENSKAQVRVTGRTDWEVTRETGKYWVRVSLHNEGAAGLVAIRVAIRSSVPYVSIGVSPTEPQYFEMAAGETRELRLTGTISAEAADRALGCVVEVYPEAPETR